MPAIYVPQYRIYYRVNPTDGRELQWTKLVHGPSTPWQHAYTFEKPIRALDIDDVTGEGVVVLEGGNYYAGSGVRSWKKRFYTAGDRIYKIYALGGSK